MGKLISAVVLLMIILCNRCASLVEPCFHYSVPDHGYKWLMPWSTAESKALVSCYLTSHGHSEVVKWYMESAALLVYRVYTALYLPSTRFGMFRASPPRLEERQPRSIFIAARTVMLQPTELYSKEQSSWIYEMPREDQSMLQGCSFSFVCHSFKVEQISGSFSPALISACCIGHVTQCCFELPQWKIARSYLWECSENPSACYGAGGVAPWHVFSIRLGPSFQDDMKHNNGTRSSHILMLAFPEIPSVIVVGLWSRFGTTIWLTWSNELMENKNFNVSTPFSCLNGGLICTFSMSMAGQTLLMPHKLRLPAQALHRTISLTDKGSPSLIVVLLSFCGEQHRIGHLLQWKHIKLIRFFHENGAWIQSELNNKDISTHDASVSIAARIPYSTNKMDFCRAAREPMILQNQCFGWISSGFILLCSGRATLLTDQFDDEEGMLSRKKYQVLAQRTEVPWDPGRLFMMSAWGQAAFQGGRDVRTLSYAYTHMGWPL